MDRPANYEIRVKGHLTPEWSSWFDGLAIRPEAHGDTVLTGIVTDQPALISILLKISSLGLPLLAVNQICPHSGDSKPKTGGDE